MPRIANPEAPEVAHLRAKLKDVLDLKIYSEMEISRATGVGQSTISKFSTGQIKSITPGVAKALIYAGIDMVDGIDRLTSNPAVRSALAASWDGTDEGAALIASMIQALAPVFRATVVKC